MAKSANSARSTSSSVPTPKRAACRASSDPIDPPAPVTITVRPPKKSLTTWSSSSTWSRPSRSSISTSRSRLTSTSPARISYNPGMIWVLTGTCSQISTIRRSSVREVLAMVITTWSMPCSATNRPISRVAPSTLTPWITVPSFCGSSSTKPTIFRFMAALAWISRAAITPACPAPTSSTGIASSPVAAVTRGPLVPLEQPPTGHPHREHPPDAEHRRHQADRQGGPPLCEPVGQPEPEQHERQQRPEPGLQKRHHLPHADVAPDEAVDPEHLQRTELDKQHQRQLDQHVLEVRLRNAELEAQGVREDEGCGQDDHVHHELRRPVQQPRPWHAASTRPGLSAVFFYFNWHLSTTSVGMTSAVG